MIVVADTSPLNYLIQIGHAELLHRLYGKVQIPSAVLMEMQSPQAPAPVKSWAQHLPDWLSVVAITVSSNPLFAGLDEGEVEAITLATSHHAELLLIDERRGTTVARSLGLMTVGTLGVLARAHARGWVDARDAFDKLAQTTSFRYTAKLRQDFFSILKL